MKQVLLVAVGVVLLLGIIACWFVWPPDVFSQRAIVLKQATSMDKRKFVLTQQWKGRDFYTTLFQVEGARGRWAYLLDGRDIKRWRCKLQVDESERAVKISFGGKVVARYYWANNLFLHNDVVVLPQRVAIQRK